MERERKHNATRSTTAAATTGPGGPVVVKYGDGGPIRGSGPSRGGAGSGGSGRASKLADSIESTRQARNTDVYLTWPFGPSDYETRPTRDRADRAHNQKDGKGVLLPAAQASGAKPRRYPPHQMTSRGVSFDSAADALAEAQERLAGVPGLGPGDSVSGRVAEALGRFEARYGSRGLRDMLRPVEDPEDDAP